MSRWIDQARSAVAKVARELPDDATLTERRKALRKVGSLFHGNTYWGRKQWGKACREYLAQYDPKAAPRPLDGKGADLGKLKDRINSGDICFPFRDQSTPPSYNRAV
jgi:hypothetical protein